MAKDKHRLVIIEWEDSVQPIASWQVVGDLKFCVVKIASVGWLVKNGKKIKALAPNIGGIDGKATPQVSGVIQIPTRCVISMQDLAEVEHG